MPNSVIFTAEFDYCRRDAMKLKEALEKGGKSLSEEDTAKKSAYTLELHSNVQGLSRLLKEMNESSSNSS